MEILQRSLNRGYSVLRVPFDSIDGSTITEWKALRQEMQDPDPHSDPDWIRGYFEGQTDTLSFYLLYRYGKLAGVASFTTKNWPLAFKHSAFAPVKSSARAHEADRS